jgi:hypothetical protein
VALIPALLFGGELQHRTLQLLLSQPLNRSRIWAEKMGVGLAAFGLIGLTLFLAYGTLKLPAGQTWIVSAVDYLWPGHEHLIGGSGDLDNIGTWIFGVTIGLATVCSTGFWALVAGSAVGGAVFAIAFEFLPLLILAGILEKLGVPDEKQVQVFEAAGIIYSVIFCWLSRRQFTRYQLQDGTPGMKMPAHDASGISKSAWWIPRWLICQPAGQVMNFVRKELMLQRPVFLIAGVLTAAWTLTFVSPHGI